MSPEQDHPTSSISLDAERHAVRQLMAAQGHTLQSEKPQLETHGNVSCDAREMASVHPADVTGLGAKPHGTGKVKTAAAGLMARLKTYRPDRKSILWTSLVLMLLLRPFLVLGWAFAFVVAVVAAYVIMGGDTFWRRVIAGYHRVQGRWPDAARQIKVRGFVLSKKWDRVLAFLPDRLSDQLRGPDLRRIIAADARHDAAMSDRLMRLDGQRAHG